MSHSSHKEGIVNIYNKMRQNPTLNQHMDYYKRNILIYNYIYKT